MLTANRLGMVELEDRSVPATFGIPWADPSLTLSFAPDGTPIAGRSSDLFAGLNQVRSENEWQESILRAFYTWTSQTNLDLAVRSDSGIAFGTPGRAQNDPRFGDIRIGGNRLSDVLAVTSPSDPALAGTLAGDVFVNTSVRFDGSPYDLSTVMLHEAGHSLGLDHSTNPNSPMYPRYQNTIGTLTNADIAAIRRLYGPSRPDRFEGNRGNHTTATATLVPVPTNYTGTTPLLAYARLSTATDVDIFAFDTVPGRGENQNITVRVQSAGLSLLGAKVTVYTLDASGQAQEVANDTSDSADYAGDTLTLTFDGNDDDDFTSRRYFIRIEKSESAPFTLGRFAVAVSFDGVNQVPDTTLDRIIQEPYQNLGPNDLALLLQDPTGTLVNVDGGANDTFAAATVVNPTVHFQGNSRFEALGSLTALDQDVYRVQASTTGSVTKVLTANVWALPDQDLVPQVAVFDAAGGPVSAEILVNDLGSYTIQAANVIPGATYYLVVTGAGTGNYFLTADFGTNRTNLPTLTAGQQTDGTTRDDTLYIAQAQLFHFVLSASSVGVPVGSSVRMTVTNSSGQVVFDLSATAGQTVSGSSVMLRPGEYRVRFTTQGTGTAPLSFTLKGNRITDPVGPVLDDPTLVPQYQNPNNPNQFLYPNGIASTNPFHWLFG